MVVIISFGFGLQLLNTPLWQSGFAVGLLVGATPVFWLAFRDATGLAHRFMGADAERWTAEELAKLSSQWTVFHDIEFEYVNVDHVVIGPSRIYAVETKWIGGVPIEAHLKRLTRQAAHRAQKLARELGEAGAALAPIPMLVLWGPGTRGLLPPHGRYVAPPGVIVVTGLESATWLGRIEAAAEGPVPDGLVQAVRDIIRT